MNSSFVGITRSSIGRFKPESENAHTYNFFLLA